MLKQDLIPSIDIQKKMARAYIGENRLEEALDIYLDILHSDPDEPEVLKVIGELYLAAGNGQTAEKLLTSVSPEFPEDDGIVRNIEIAANARVVCEEEPIPTSPEAIRRLLQKLTSRDKPISDEELVSAANLLTKIVHSPNPAIEVANHLNEIDSLLPALIDLNIQQAKIDGKSALADGLKELKTNITLQKSISDNKVSNQVSNNENEPVNPFSGKVAVYHQRNPEIESSQRIKLMESLLLSNGCLVSEKEDSTSSDLAVFSNPFYDSQSMEKMVKFSAAGVPIILDIDQYYECVGFPDLTGTSSGVQAKIFDRAYVSSLILADLITVTSEPYAEHLRSSGYPAVAVPSGWSLNNPYWAVERDTSGSTIQLGWFGSSGNLDDLAVIRRPLIRVLSEFNDKVRIIIVGDQDAYRMFEHVPDALKTFIPCLSPQEIPYILNQMDILLMPLRKTVPNVMVSDELLMYAGIKKIPWVASFFPVAKNWNKGGLICTTLEEWHTSLRCLILDRELRQTLGSEGFHKAMRREMLSGMQQWYRAFNLVLSSKTDGKYKNAQAQNYEGHS